jgi:hypothetical protein
VDIVILAAISTIVFLVAFLFSNLGLGGGLLYMPLLILIGLLPFPEARPVSLAAALATSAVSALNHRRAGKLEARKGALASAVTMAGVVVGVFAIRSAPDAMMEVLFGLFLIAVAAQMYRDFEKEQRGVALGAWMLPVAGVLAFGSGLVSIALAVGGGLLLVPLFVYVMRVEPRSAVGTSSMVAAINAIAGLALLYLLPSPGTTFDLGGMTVLAAVAAGGSYLGSRWGLENLKTRSVYLLIIVVMAGASAAMLLRGLGLT